MAAAVDDNSHQLQQIRVFRELFHGRFTDAEAAILLELNNSDSKVAAAFVMQSNPLEVRQLLENEKRQWTEVKHKVRGIRQRRSVYSQAKQGTISTDARMFACGPCDDLWWRKTPNRKKVSKCNKCRTRYDCLPRHCEWGLAEFTCNKCQHYFRGWCGMWFPSPCYICREHVYPTRILPPFETKPRRKTRSRHCCAAPDCAGYRLYAGAPYGEGINDDVMCTHPGSRQAQGKKKVLKPSEVHDSTGSTVDTFLSQHHLQELPKDEYYYQPLPSIPED